MRDHCVRIILIEDDPAMRQSLLDSIGSEDDFEVVAACATYAEGSAAISSVQADVLITDLKLPDGHGGQLMSIIAMSRLGTSEPEEIETSAQAALEDLRMLIGSLDVENDISGMLGTFRERAEQQLALAGIELDWQMIEVPEIEGLNPSHALNILRILQQATTNAAKHSGADTVSIRFSLPPALPEILSIDVEDNGRGMRQGMGRGMEPVSTSGHGIGNIRSRAREVNGNVAIASSREGTRVTFTMPISIKPDDG